MHSEVCPKDGYCAVIPTFDKVDGSVLTLGDITPVKGGTKDITSANFSLQLLDETGETALITREQLEGVIPEDKLDAFMAEHEEDYFEFCYDEGTWYLKCDDTYEMNGFKIPLGTGLLMFATSKLTGGAKLLFSGVVLAEETQSPLCDKDSYRFTGNIAPANMKLGEFYPIKGGTKEVTSANFSIQLLDETGETAILTREPLEGVIPEDKLDDFMAEHEEDYFEFCYDEGTWYLKCDDAYEMNNFKFKPGQGILLFATSKLTGGAKLSLPSAL